MLLPVPLLASAFGSSFVAATLPLVVAVVAVAHPVVAASMMVGVVGSPALDGLGGRVVEERRRRANAASLLLTANTSKSVEHFVDIERRKA